MENVSMRDSPLVSFIVISYKHKKYIGDCLESILSQTYSNMEILYLDDASGDGTFQKACEYKRRLEEKFIWTEFIENVQNRGLVANLNMLIQMSKGEYIKFLAADDFMLCDGIKKMVDALETSQKYDMMYSNGVIGDEGTRFPYENVGKEKLIYQEVPLYGGGLFEALYERDFILAPSVMTRRCVYEKTGLYDQTIGVEDWDFYLRIAKEGMIGYLQEPTVMYRMLASSLSHSTDPKRRINMKKSELQILEKHQAAAEKAHIRMLVSLNEAIQDAYHIDDKEYISYLHLYARRNGIRINCRNRIKGVLYKLGIIRLMCSRMYENGPRQDCQKTE